LAVTGSARARRAEGCRKPATLIYEKIIFKNTYERTREYQE